MSNPSNQPPPRNRKRTLISASIVLVLVAGGIAWTLWPRTQKPGPAFSAVTDAARSGDYASVRQAVDSGKLKPEEVGEAIRKEFETQALARINDFHDATDAQQKQRVLDKAIDDFEKFRAESRKAAASRPATTKPASGVDPRLRVTMWALSQPPDTRARLAEFNVAMEKRRRERGLPGMFETGVRIPLGGN